MERAVSISETVLASSKFPEILGRPGDDVIIQLEHNATSGLGINCNIELTVLGP